MFLKCHGVSLRSDFSLKFGRWIENELVLICKWRFLNLSVKRVDRKVLPNFAKGGGALLKIGFMRRIFIGIIDSADVFFKK